MTHSVELEKRDEQIYLELDTKSNSVITNSTRQWGFVHYNRDIVITVIFVTIVTKFD